MRRLQRNVSEQILQKVREPEQPADGLVMDAVEMEKTMEGAELVFTGEGCLDHQTAMGKAPVGVAKLAKKYGAKVIALAGAVVDGAEKCNENGIDAYFPIIRKIVTLDEAMEQIMRLVTAVSAAE